MTSLYGSEIERALPTRIVSVKELFPDADCAHLAELSDMSEPQHQRQRQCVLSRKIRRGGHGLSLLHGPAAGLAFRCHFAQFSKQ